MISAMCGWPSSPRSLGPTAPDPRIPGPIFLGPAREQLPPEEQCLASFLRHGKLRDETVDLRDLFNQAAGSSGDPRGQL